MRIYLYGPPGSGKSVSGCALALNLNIPFIDLDIEIEKQAGCSIPEIFASAGESGFRTLEKQILLKTFMNGSAVIALGGGALLDDQSRDFALSNGEVICLTAPLDKLIKRLGQDSINRPLLSGELENNLVKLISARSSHYASFKHILDTGELTPQEAAWSIQIQTGFYHIRGMGEGYDVVVQEKCINQIGSAMVDYGLKSNVAVVTDENVGGYYGDLVEQSLLDKGFKVTGIRVPSGESSKTISTVNFLWEKFVAGGLERSSTVIALGGGVIGDMSGFAAATYMRGVRWVGLPTSLLAMIDSSLGGKTAVDLPQGKNLVGAFYAPRLVWTDPLTLKTLPDRELRNGLAEVVKHGVIGDPILFEMCAEGWNKVKQNLGEIVRRAMAVKVKIILQDPYEKNLRQALNLGHTIGHGVETASSFHLLHGEAVSIGMVAAAKIAQHEGVAKAGLVDQIIQVLIGLDLPTEIPDDIDRDQVLKAMFLDKKRVNGRLRFALPVQIGEVGVGFEVDRVEDYIRRG